MTVLPAGTQVPHFTLATAEGGQFTEAALLDGRTLLVFYPNAFSPVCTDQLQILEEVKDDFLTRGVSIIGVSCDATYSQTAFNDKLGITIPQLSDFEPKGSASRIFGAYFERAGISTRALVLTDETGKVAWSWEGEHPGVMPPVSLVLDALDELGW